MKKFLLGLSMACFAIAMVCSWFNGNVGYSVGVSIAMLLFMWLTLSFMKRHRTVRFAMVVIITAIALFFGSMNVSLLAYRKNNPKVQKSDGMVNVSELQTDKEHEEKKEETNIEEDEEKIENEESSLPEETDNKPSDSKKKDDNEPIVVEKIVEKRVEVPVEKVVEKIEYVEVPVVEYVEVTPPAIEPENVKPITPPALPQFGYSGDPTMGNYGYDYGYGSNYGDPTMNNNYYYDNNYTSSVTISGDKKVSLGETVCYTISGVNSISESKLKLPYGVSLEKIRGNKVYLTFDEVGTFYIKYGSTNINIKVQSDD